MTNLESITHSSSSRLLAAFKRLVLFNRFRLGHASFTRLHTQACRQRLSRALQLWSQILWSSWCCTMMGVSSGSYATILADRGTCLHVLLSRCELLLFSKLGWQNENVLVFTEAPDGVSWHQVWLANPWFFVQKMACCIQGKHTNESCSPRRNRKGQPRIGLWPGRREIARLDVEGKAVEALGMHLTSTSLWVLARSVDGDGASWLVIWRHLAYVL